MHLSNEHSNMVPFLKVLPYQGSQFTGTEADNFLKIKIDGRDRCLKIQK